jgi:hypothetical protein
MKWIRVLLFAFLCTPLASLAGEYDGVWRPAGDTPDMYYFIYHFGGTIIMPVLSQSNTGKYEGNWCCTAIGSISGGSANLSLSDSGKSATFSINFTSLTSGTITATSCSSSVPNDPCPPINTPVAFVRLL